VKSLTTGLLRRALLVSVLPWCSVARAHLLTVPEIYPSINAAVAQSDDGDTVLVDRGIYPEQLWFPSHRISIMSYYEMTGDTVDVLETVIEGYSYADHDTATIALFLPGSADSSKLCGFTLRGGRGIGPGTHSGVFLADSCSPVICHNIMTDNQTLSAPAGNFYYCSGVFRGNRVFDNSFLQSAVRINYNLYADPVLIDSNVFGGNPRSPASYCPGVYVQVGASAVLTHNLFRGLTGHTDLAVSYNGRNPVISNNIFDSLSVTGWASGIVWIYGALHVVMTDNIFSNLVSEDGVIMVLHGDNHQSLTVEGNLFEQITAPGFNGEPACAGIHCEGYVGLIRNNIFRGNHGITSGAVYLIGEGLGSPSGLMVEYNLFEACSASVAGCFYRGPYDGPLTARYNIIRSNSGPAVVVDTAFPRPLPDFTLNYWGDPSGPYHPLLNPDGLGDEVGDSILFDPWLTDSIIDAVPPKLPPLPDKFSIESFPNPFNPETRIKLAVPEPGRYRLELYDLLGRKVRDIFDGAVVIDREVSLYAGDLPSGVYFARASETLSRHPVAIAKLVLLK
jgi:hypothetical protein